MPSPNSRLSEAGPKAATLRQALVSLAIRTTIVIILTWAVLYLFQSVLAQYLGVTDLHIHVSGSVATIAISFVLITTIRRLIHKSIPMISPHLDRKSTRLNSSHANISYAVFCLKKKKTTYVYKYI